MDVDGISYDSLEKMPSLQDDYNTLFVNYAAVAWHEMRRAWRGNRSVASQRKPTEPITRYSTSCKDLLSSKEPFEEPVPLAMMVEFLAEVWEEIL
ncbi:hypothetical protein ABFS82_12G143700 [Erythranthe guttata]|uniref:DUF4050 domain-containing protein n=1 Tax=Erythranthe guttata TaxID=4155 RepID=A0A022REE3_ERYGU|nr:PREDICTED: uncharacterized protein LOC105956553 isoform X1 [Erythranthe guttata]EYU38566.1 hypothetical protein MIMGU_mgv1a017082mg [Erythranthe guttata]|eukprot:XP_012835857.1 PREDICTED: uncharacterized protein LOC105956553 isoform X1 [Erythranthe guttata]